MNHIEHAALTTAIEAAEILARAIRATPEWKSFENARTSFEHDAELQELVSRYRRLAGLWQTAQQRGQGLMGSAAVELAQVRSQIEAHPVYQQERETAGAVLALLQKLNQRISEELGLDFAANAAPRGGGCCG